MIFKLSANSENFYIAPSWELIERLGNVKSNGRFTTFERSFKRITKDYRNSKGETIVYGVRPKCEIIKFTIECTETNYRHIINILNNNYIYNISYNYYHSNKYSYIMVRLSGDLSESKIYNGNDEIEALYTVSGTFEEV